MTKLVSVIIYMCFIAQLTTAIQANPGSGGSASSDETRVETRVYLRKQCLLSEEKDVSSNEPQFLGALAAIFIPLIIEKALGGISGALKKAGSPETLKDAGRSPVYLYRISKDIEGRISYNLNPDNKCVIVVRGTFSGADKIADSAQSKIDFSAGDGIFKESTDDHRSKRITRLQNSNIPVVRIMAAYEAKINLSDDKTAMNYESRFLEVNGFQGKRSADKRSLVVSLAFYGVGSKEGEPTLSLALMNLSEAKKGVVLEPKKLEQQRSTWLGGVGMTDASLKSIEKMELDNNTSKGLMPVTIEGMFVETSKGSDALLFIAEVLDAKKSDVAKTISGEILKDESQEAATAAEALEKMKSDEEAAQINYLKAANELEKVCAVITGNPYTQAQKVLMFDRDRTFRVWKLKYDALAKYGAVPEGRSTEIYRCQNAH